MKPTNVHVTVRKAANGEAGLLAGLIRRAFQDVAAQFHLNRKNCPRHPSNCSADWVVTDLRNGTTFFLAEEGGPVGCGGLEVKNSRTGALSRLCVLPEYRCRGVGDSLLKAIEAEALSRGLLFLEIGIIARHNSLRGWYEKRGFRAVARKNYRHLPFEVLSMTKEIAGRFDSGHGDCGGAARELG